jgi:ferric-dicitrate binding protein FerR (iron transport regulator)
MATGNGEIKTLLLPDSTVVVLNANSSISYSTDISKKHTREVWLEGEAFFTVKHIAPDSQAARRFIVHSGDLNVEVLGTTFNVNKRATVTNVSLNTGKIKIDVKDQPESAIFLQPGDFIQYSVVKKHILRKRVKAELYSVWKEQKLVLDKMPLSAIAQLIQDAFGHKVTITDKRLAESKVSGTLFMKDETAILETLSFVLDINILKQDDVLFFQPKSKTKN